MTQSCSTLITCTSSHQQKQSKHFDKTADSTRQPCLSSGCTLHELWWCQQRIQWWYTSWAQLIHCTHCAEIWQNQQTRGRYLERGIIWHTAKVKYFIPAMCIICGVLFPCVDSNYYIHNSYKLLLLLQWTYSAIADVFARLVDTLTSLPACLLVIVSLYECDDNHPQSIWHLGHIKYIKLIHHFWKYYYILKSRII